MERLPDPLSECALTVSERPNLNKVMSLRNKGYFSMHGVVLQNRIFRTRRAMFHVKHFCVIRESA
jgi:hypothetical protein